MTDKKYTIFTRGCFDCLHLGHFVLLTTMLVECSKLLKCSPLDIDFLISLAGQNVEKFKNIKFVNTEEERKNNLLKTEIINNVIISNSSKYVLIKNIDKIKCFCIGEDQEKIPIFQEMIDTCKAKNINILKLPSKILNVSSTLIRKEMFEKKINYIEAKKNIEAKAILNNDSLENILMLKKLNMISESCLDFFNIKL